MPNNSDFEALYAVVGVICTLTVVSALKHKRWRRRRWWTRPWIRRRDEGIGNIHSLLKDELCSEDPECFKNYLRMGSTSFNKLRELVRPFIEKKNTNMRESISVEKRLSVTLRFLASGESYVSLSYGYRIPPSTLSGIIPETCRAIYEALKPKYLKVPSTEKEWIQISKDYYNLWNFPNCLGSMDGKHIEFQAPRSSGSYYFNYKGFNSIVLLAVVDAYYRFLFIDVGCNGRSSDGGVYINSELSYLINNNILNFPAPSNLPNTNIALPYTLVADDAFALGEHIMKPFNSRGTTKERRVFNYRLSRARRTVENAFGILANRFRVLMTKINLPVEKVQTITLASCALHNYLISENMPFYLNNLDCEDTESRSLTAGSRREGHSLKCIERQGGNRSSSTALETRDKLCQYFNSVGAVPWQWECVKKFNF